MAAPFASLTSSPFLRLRRVVDMGEARDELRRQSLDQGEETPAQILLRFHGHYLRKAVRPPAGSGAQRRFCRPTAKSDVPIPQDREPLRDCLGLAPLRARCFGLGDREVAYGSCFSCDCRRAAAAMTACLARRCAVRHGQGSRKSAARCPWDAPDPCGRGNRCGRRRPKGRAGPATRA